MKCPVCKSEMTEGTLPYGTSWTKNKWNAGFFFGKKVKAYLCPECGKVELQVALKK